MMPNAVIGISGAVVFPSTQGHSAEIARRCPLDRLVLETDAPFLAEDPEAIPRLAARVAEIRGAVGVGATRTAASEILAAANANCVRFYGLGVESFGGAVGGMRN